MMGERKREKRVEGRRDNRVSEWRRNTWKVETKGRTLE